MAWSTSPGRPPTIGVDQVTVATLAAQVHALRLADDVLAGGDLIGPAFRELNAAVAVCRRGGHTDRISREVLALVGEFAQIAGWIASDAGDVDRALAFDRLAWALARAVVARLAVHRTVPEVAVLLDRHQAAS